MRLYTYFEQDDGRNLRQATTKITTTTTITANIQNVLTCKTWHFRSFAFICSLSYSWRSGLATNVYDYIHDKKKERKKNKQTNLSAAPRLNKLIITLSRNSAGCPSKTTSLLRRY